MAAIGTDPSEEAGFRLCRDSLYRVIGVVVFRRFNHRLLDPVVTARTMAALCQTRLGASRRNCCICNKFMPKGRQFYIKADVILLVGVSADACVGTDGLLCDGGGVTAVGQDGHDQCHGLAAIGTGLGEDADFRLRRNGVDCVGEAVIASCLQGGKLLGHRLACSLHQLEVHAKLGFCARLALIGDFQRRQSDRRIAGVGQDDGLTDSAAVLPLQAGRAVQVRQGIVHIRMGRDLQFTRRESIALCVHTGGSQRTCLAKGLEANLHGGNGSSVTLDGKGDRLTAV